MVLSKEYLGIFKEKTKEIEEKTLYQLWKELSKFDNIDENKVVDILNEIAKRFLVREGSRDSYIFERILEKELKEDLEDEEIKSHIEWVIKFLKDVKMLEIKENVELNERKCKLGKMLLEKKKNLSEKNEMIEEIDRLHRTLHRFAEKVYRNIRNRDYVNAYHYYVRCLKASYGLISLLSVKNLKEYSQEAIRDGLTELLNRRKMWAIMRDVMELSMLSGRAFSIAIIDIDNFKKLNDENGHLVGDIVLREVAKEIEKNVRKSDYVFRYGGEEFLVLMPSTDLEEAVKVMEQVRQKIENKEIKCDKKVLRVSVSIGVCSDVYDGKKLIEDYIECADKKLYEAKRKGKNRVEY